MTDTATIQTKRRDGCRVDQPASVGSCTVKCIPESVQCVYRYSNPDVVYVLYVPQRLLFQSFHKLTDINRSCSRFFVPSGIDLMSMNVLQFFFFLGGGGHLIWPPQNLI